MSFSHVHMFCILVCSIPRRSSVASWGRVYLMSKRAVRLVVCLLLLVGLFRASSPAQGLPNYSKVATLNYNNESVLYAIFADLNGDGLNDVIGCFNGTTGQDLVVWYQSTSHTFPSATYLASTQGCAFMAVGDINGDDMPDLLATSRYATQYTLLASSGGNLVTSTGTNLCSNEGQLYIVSETAVSVACTVTYSGGTLQMISAQGPFVNGGFVVGPQLGSSSSYSLIQAYASGANDSGFDAGGGGLSMMTQSSYGPGAMPDWYTYWAGQTRTPVSPFWACVPVEVNIGQNFACISYGESTDNTQSSNYYIYYTVAPGLASSVALPGYSFSALAAPCAYAGEQPCSGPARGLFNVFPWNFGNGSNDFVVANADGNLYAALHTGTGAWAAPQLLVTIPEGAYIFDARQGGTELPGYFLTSDVITPGTTATPQVYGNDVNVWTAPPLSSPTSTIVSTSNSSIYYGANVTFTASVASASGSPTGTVTFYADGAAIGTATLATGTASITNSSLTIGSHSITAAYTPTGPYQASTGGSITQTITKIPTGLNVTINPTPGYVTQNVAFTINVTAADGSTPTGTVTVAADGTPIGTPTLNGGSASVSTSSLALGNHSVTVSYPGTSTYDYSSTTVSEQISQMPTSAALTLSPSSSVSYGNSVTFTATVTSSYGTPTGTVTFTAGGAQIGVATLNGSGVASVTTSSLGANNYTVTASYGGSTNYVASSGNNTLTVNRDDVKLNWLNPSAIVYGTALDSTQLNATVTYNGVSVPGTLTYTPAAGTVLSAGTQTLNVVFTPTDTANYNSTSKAVTLTVNKAAPVLIWTNPAPITYGTPITSTQLNATANVAGLFAYSPGAGTVLQAGTQLLTVTFTPTDATDYNSVTQSAQVQVNKANPVLSWTTPDPITFGVPLSSLQLNATASGVGGVNLPGQMTYTPGSGNFLNAGSQTLTVSFVPTDSADYNDATASVQLQVNKAAPHINWANPASITYGSALSGTQLNASSGNVKGSFVYTPAAGTVLSAGAQTLTTVFTPEDSVNYSTGTATVQLQVNKAVPAITWPNPAAISYGTPLSTDQLNASSGNVAGSFVYRPASGAVLNAGLQTLSTVFTPNDTANFTTASATVPLTVNMVMPTLTVSSSNNPSIYNSPVTFTASISSGPSGFGHLL